MKLHFFCRVIYRTGIWLGVLVGALFMGQNASAVISFNVTPSVFSNTYAGPVTLQINGLTNTETVVVQKYLDPDGSGTLDSSGILVQQFQLTDGQAAVFTDGSTSITNYFIPGDSDGLANGSITTPLYPSLDFEQMFVGTYVFVLSSPAGHFPAITNSVSITNFPYAQTITGNLVSNNVPLPYGVIILLQSSGNGNENPVAGVMVNGSGSYSIKAPPGPYTLLGFRGGFVAAITNTPSINLSASTTITTNVPVTLATKTISGQITDANSGLGLAGLSLFIQSTNQVHFAIGFTDTNGNFSASAVSDVWKIQPNSTSLPYKGYLQPQGNLVVNTTTGSVSGLNGALAKATAIFYGTLKDNNGNPLSGVAIASSDNNNNYYTDGYTYTNGNFVAPALAGSDDAWQVQMDSGGPTNYIYSQPAFDFTGGTNLTVGQALKVKITGILATNIITGNVQFNGNPVTDVGVSASSTISGVTYNASTSTDNNGNYSLNIVNGYTWSVSVNCDGNNSLSGALGNNNFQCPANQNVVINNDNGTANFTIQPCGGIQILETSPLPGGTNGVYYSLQFGASSCDGNLTWSVNDPSDLPPGLTMYSGGAFNGTPGATGTYNFSVHVQDDNGNSTNQSFSLTIASGSEPLQITTSTTLNNATNGSSYSLTFQASGGTPPYGWYVPDYSAPLPSLLNLSVNGLLAGTVTASSSTYYFYIDVTDSVANFEEEQFTLNVESPPLTPLIITNVSLPNGNVGMTYSAQLGVTGGQPPYNWSIALGSANPPPGLSLSSNGLISGTPTTNKLVSFKVQVTDAASEVTNKVLAIIVNPDPSISPLAKANGAQFQFLLLGAANQNYTVQMSTNLVSTNWISLFTTNNAVTNSFIVTDPSATNQQRFYRVLIGP